MTTVQGYYEGNAVMTLEKLDAQVNQKVQITMLDEFMEEKPKRKAGILKSKIEMADTLVKLGGTKNDRKRN